MFLLKIWLMLNFQDYNSFIMMLMMEFHDFSMLVLFMIIMFIFYLLYWYMGNMFINKNILHNQFIEVIWTLIPMIILIFMILPSLNILYLIEDLFNPYMTIKIMGHQWYWSYEYVDFKQIDFDSFMINSVNKEYFFRLLDVDNRLILPINFMIRGLVSSMDVIHSWAVPVLGVKVDAVPGRINQLMLNLERLGVYYGQCSEICGLNHSFMPIVLEGVNMKYFLKWLRIF